MGSPLLAINADNTQLSITTWTVRRILPTLAFVCIWTTNIIMVLKNTCNLFQLTNILPCNYFWCRIHLWFRLMGGLQAKSMTSQR